MKKIIAAILITGIITLLSGCLSTLHPLFTEKDLVFDPRLIGSWNNGPDDNGSIVFARGSTENFRDLPQSLQAIANKAYAVTMTDKDGEIKYYAFLSRIGNELYLDYYPAETSRQKQYDDFFKQHLVKLHSLYHVQFAQNQSLRIRQFDEGFLKNLINNKKIRISHEVMFDGSYLITASTEELQQYVLKYGDVPEAYSNEKDDTFYKIK